VLIDHSLKTVNKFTEDFWLGAPVWETRFLTKRMPCKEHAHYKLNDWQKNKKKMLLLILSSLLCEA